MNLFEWLDLLWLTLLPPNIKQNMKEWLILTGSYGVLVISCPESTIHTFSGRCILNFLSVTISPPLLVHMLHFLKKFIYLFIFGCVGYLLLHVGFSLVVASGGYCSLQCVGFSLWWLFLLCSMGSRCMGFSSCGAQASVVAACGLSSCGSWVLQRRLSSYGAWA